MAVEPIASGGANAPTRPRRRRIWLWIALAAVLLVVAAIVAALLALPFSSDALRATVIAALSDRFDSEVELQSLQLRALPRLHVEGTGLTIRHHGRRDVPPLISINAFSVDGDLIGLLRNHVARVTLDGLDIEIPPDYDQRDTDTDGGARQFVIDTLDARDARLAILPERRDKGPKTWAIHALHLHAVGADRRMPFEATLTNAVPPGEIATSGHFGPWRTADPGATRLDGTFTFANADLSVFDGISGILSARGTFGGSLRRIDIHGETDTPQFTVNLSGQPVPLHATYHTIVDGTNGNTRLERIDASFLNSSLVAHGSVIDAKGIPGRRVRLDVTMDRARIEDVMRLAVKSPRPPMIGALALTTTFDLPPGKRPVVDKLRLDGRFSIRSARLTSFDIQAKIDELSHRSRGQNAAAPPPHVTSDFEGRFKLVDGVLELPEVRFGVPGAVVQLAGRYALRAETLDFRGRLFMDAKVSQTTSGLKSLLLKVVDPLFRGKRGGSALPIKVTGTRKDPQFGLDVRRVFKR